jgi:DNA invertase Pin-like site-specific DNA recombinase
MWWPVGAEHTRAALGTSPRRCGEFERAKIRERVLVGLERARDQGKRLGRRPIAPLIVDRIEKAAGDGLSMRAVAKKVGVGVGTVHRVLSGQHVTQADD